MSLYRYVRPSLANHVSGVLGPPANGKAEVSRGVLAVVAARVGWKGDWSPTACVARSVSSINGLFGKRTLFELISQAVARFRNNLVARYFTSFQRKASKESQENARWISTRWADRQWLTSLQMQGICPSVRHACTCSAERKV